MNRAIHTMSLMMTLTLVLATSVWAQSAGQPTSGHPPVDVTGTIKSVDKQAGTITFEDGRTVKATGQTIIWQPSKIDALQPGSQAFLHNAQPALTQAMNGMRMGTVVRVDPVNALILLNDGTLVSVSPSTKMQMQDKRLTISELQPGDEIVFRPRAGATTSSSAVAPRGQDATAARGTNAPSAMVRSPQPMLGSPVDADEIRVVRRSQAP